VTRVSKKSGVSIFLSAILFAFVPHRALAQFPPAPGTGPGLAETVEAIDRARVTTRILYITAHPDDESATLLTYLARGLHADVALLTLTRGEGGQNDLGPEQAPQLGLIRTQELLAATRGYGIKLYFGGAPDFGFSKTTEETQKVWGDAALGNMVRVIRTYRPNIVINGWGGVHGGHGHHQTSGLWTPRAAALAADANAFPEQLTKEGLSTWGGGSHSVVLLDTERSGTAAAAANGYTLPVDEISSLWGKSWRDIALDAFANHRSQGIAGFLGSPFLRRTLVLIREDGTKFDSGVLAQPLENVGVESASQTNFRPALAQAESSIRKAHEAALALKWEEAASNLADAAKTVEFISHENGKILAETSRFELEKIRQRIDRALTLVAGVQLRAEADRDALVAGESFTVTAEARCREEAGCKLGELHLALPREMSDAKTEKDAVRPGQFKIHVDAPAPPFTAWEKSLPELPPLVFARQEVTVADYKFEAEIPVTHIAASSSHVDRVPLRIVPAYTLAVDPKQAVEVLAKPKKPFDILLRVHSYATQPGRISVGVEVPEGWTSGAPMALEFAGAGDQYAKLTVAPPAKLGAGDYTLAAYAKRGDEKFADSLEPLPSLPTQYWQEPAKCLVHAFDINVPENLRVGYITAEGEPIPEALERLGMRVETLDAQALAFRDLSKFSAIVVGVRAYELRPELPGANQRLLDYVSKGGTLVVQYNRDSVWDKLQPAPYPAKIGTPTPRTTDENSPVKFLKPDDPLLNTPNKITQDDFKSWVQERGLYYWSQFDAKYTPLLAMNDPGEADLSGALVYVKYGQGTYIYTGIAFFRQLPEGVPGAYRLFVNLLSASRTK
jgi:LmbE family N-acetylglucosaminyl deacetylase